MPLKVKGLETAISTLSTTHKRMTQAALEELEQGAIDIRDRARMYVPVKTTALTKAIVADKPKVTGVQTKIVVRIRPGKVSKYAAWMHEGVPTYNLRKRSREKAEALGVEVGPKFLSRAANELFPAIKKRISERLRKI